MEILKQQSNIDFLGRRRIALIVSTALLVTACTGFLVRGLNLGIDFTGGTLVEVGYQDPVQIEAVRAALAESGFDDAVVQYFGTPRDVMVRLPATFTRQDASAAEISSGVMVALRKPYSEILVETSATDRQQCTRNQDSLDCSVQMRRVEFVGPQVGDELANQGGLAMLYALLGILVYVTYRFEWRFALGSVAALVHDVVITVGVFSVFQLEFSLPVLAAVLAVIGYSLNDTIVVYDRIRENFRKMRKQGVLEIMNTAINQTLPRTILTSLTTLLVVGTLLTLGGEIIRGFSLALLVGVIVGTYSSIFVASPIVMALGISREDMMPVQKEGAVADGQP
ncbi:MAG: protein translocase subunit SecF [Gammaproteobacteria bacterium]|nr:protein translocase subunit SecF [Gammaproteobacteria bacterium]